MDHLDIRKALSAVLALATVSCTGPTTSASADVARDDGATQARRGHGHGHGHGNGHGNGNGNGNGNSDPVAELRARLTAFGVVPITPAPTPSPELYELGRLLAFDPILSGNQDIACLTCHHPTTDSDDNRALPLGTGGTGLGTARTGGTTIPRNAPELFNRHMFNGMFWDSRVALDDQGRFITPAGNQLTPPMQQVLRDGYGALAAQAMFPPTSPGEMRGQPGDNPIADIPNGEFLAIWGAYMGRIGAIPEYRTRFEAAYPGTAFDDMSFAHVGNAIGAFEATAFLSTGSPFAQFVAGDDAALTAQQIQGGIDYFDAGCGTCHGGPMLSDAEHHNTAVAQIGPGTRGGIGNLDDFGRVLVTGHPDDRFAFRSPSLHNVELTGPWGHAGQFNDLRVYIEHYIDPEQALRDWTAVDNVDDPALHGTQVDNIELVLRNLSPGVSGGVPAHLVNDDMMAFMGALTDPAMTDLTPLIPVSVPSGLPVGGL